MVRAGAAVYEGLYRVVGPRRISQFIEQLVRPHVIDDRHDAAYADMAKDTTREQEALEWAEALMQGREDIPPIQACMQRG